MYHKKSIFDISDTYTNFLVDIWGVIHDGHRLFPHVKETLTKLKSMGKEVIFLSNSPRRSHIIKEHFLKFGITPQDYHDIYTSGEDAHNQIINHADQYPFLTGQAYVFSCPIHDSLLVDCNIVQTQSIEQARYIFNSSFDSNCKVQGADLENLLQYAVDHKLPMICVNPDLGAIENGIYGTCAGTLALKFEQMGGTVFYHGKPHPEIYRGALKRFSNLQKSATIAIGDTLRTDIEGAVKFGIDSILVLSGVEMHFAHGQSFEQVIDNAPYKPTFVIDQLQ